MAFVMRTRTAVITGVLGQDGRLMSALLLSRGYRVIGVLKPGRIPPSGGPMADVTYVMADISDPQEVRRLLDTWAPDEWYHLAAFHHASQAVTISNSLAGKESMIATNFMATKALAFAALESQSTCHVVYAASSQMYTAQQMTEVIDENSARRPTTFYGHTKSWSIELLAFLRKESQLRSSSAILFNHESPLRGVQFVTRKITQAVAQAAKGLNPTLQLHNLATRVDWSSAKDVVYALSLMGASMSARDYVVASGKLHSVEEMLEVAFGYVGLEWQRFTVVNQDRQSAAVVGDTTAIETSLGWKRSVAFNEMVAEMVEHDLAITSIPENYL